MAVLGIVLIALAVLFGLGVSVSSTASTKLEVFGVDFGVSVPTVYFLGAVTGAALVAGLWLLKKGLGRTLRRRKEMRELRAQVTQSDSTPELSTERDETLVDDAPATEEPVARHSAADPTEHRQPH
ncbi:hypothetical protein [Kribbella sp. NPDC004875]|uniref:hypothetical protein n=1 Tax=Kribbella sp. NPDC004875 TaxID=3364107 RepID=UPI0036A66482